MREGVSHVPVMVREVLDALALVPGAAVVDATLGAGGHAAAILAATAPDGTLVGIDRDPHAIREAKQRLSSAGTRVTFVRGRMAELGAILTEMGIDAVDGILADLGVSSLQLDEGFRGMSFRQDAPLDMRMDPDVGESAAELLVRLDAAEIEAILRDYGEERHARRIAMSLARRKIETTGELAKAVVEALPPAARHGRIHPATRVFQALRIAVNDELGELAQFLAEAPRRLTPGGRLTVISYHSLEDRLVKHAFRACAAAGSHELVMRKALPPREEEIAENPRARSAKLRALARAEGER
jgi:16S rRNA (cytosine1402-N4)-methyltransferase